MLTAIDIPNNRFIKLQYYTGISIKKSEVKLQVVKPLLTNIVIFCWGGERFFFPESTFH